MLLDDVLDPPFPFEDRFRNELAGLEEAEEREEFTLADATASVASVEGETAESSTREGRSRIEGTGLSERWGEYESSAPKTRTNDLQFMSRTINSRISSRLTLGCRLVAPPRQLQQRREEAEQGRQDQVADPLGDDPPDQNGRDACKGCKRRPPISRVLIASCGGSGSVLKRTDEEFGQYGRAPHPEFGRRAPLMTVRGGREAGGSPCFADHDPCDDGEERYCVFEARAFLDGL